MRKEERGEEHDTTTHLIKIQILLMLYRRITLACIFVPTESCSRFQSLWGLYDPSVGSSLPKSPQLPAITKRTLEAFG